MKRLAMMVWLLGAVACGGAAEDSGDDPDSPDAGVVDDGDDAAPPVGESAGLVINEVMAKNRLSVLDDHGGNADWVELYNPTADDVSLAGWAITDNLDKPRKHELDSGLVVPAGGHLLLWLDGMPELGAAHVDFKLATEGGEVGLTDPDGAFVDRVIYDEQTTDLSAARTPDGSGRWAVVWDITPGAPNPGADPEPPGADPESIPAAGDVSEQLLSEAVVPVFGIELSDAAMDDLRSQPYNWVPGVLVYEGRRFAPVGVRLKGQNSFQPFDQKPSFKVKIDRYVRGAELLGLDDLTLNNMDDDATKLHERIGYRVARMVGVPASRSNHAQVTVNGQAYGVYANVETTDRRLIERWFADATGPLYEGWDVDFTDEYIDLFEHEGGPDDRAALEGLAEALLLPGPAAMAAAAEFVDLDEFRRYWAMCAVIGQFDSFPYSLPGDDYHLYVDPLTGTMSFLPWGMDETFSWPGRHVLAVNSILAKRCLEDTACTDALIAEIWDVLDEVESADIGAEIDAVADEMAALIAADSRKPHSNATVTAAQQSMRSFIDNRRAVLESQLGAP